MAARNMKTFDPVAKLPSNTLKRHPKMDLNKNDLLRLLSFLEGELQAGDITIAALKAEKAKQLLYQAKYGRFGLGDPFHALQRDSDSQKDNSFDESAVKAMYDNQLIQLENLIATQRNAHQRMREQLVAVEKRYHKVCAELEEEKQKHAQDTAQGDDVTYMLEKDRERLKQELEFEKNQVKKLEKENKKLSTALDEEQAMSTKHKQVALVLIKERKHYMEKLAVLQHRNTYLENALKEDKTKMKTMVEGLAQEGHKSLLMEAALEKQLSEFDTEREQLKGRLTREEARNAELAAQVEKLKMQLDMTGTQSVRGASPIVTPLAKPAAAQSPKTFKDGRVQVIHRRNSPERDSPINVSSVARQPGVDPGSKHAPLDINNGQLAGKVGDRVGQHYVGQERPVPAQKPLELNTSRVNVIASSGTVLSSSSGNTTVLTTPSGARISLSVGASTSSSSVRKPTPLGRGVPPPLPPNKPQVYIPSGGPANATPRKDNMPNITLVTKSSDASPSPEMPPSQNLDSFGREMEDLQKLLVSMATGPSENSSSSLDSSPSSSVSSSVSSSLSSLSSSSSHPVSNACTTVLHKIVASGNVQTLEEYLSQNPQVDLASTAKDGSTVLHTAAELGHTDVLDLLINKGCNVAALNNDQATPLHLAASDGNLTCLTKLLDSGANLSAVDQAGWTPLHWSANQGHLDCCRYLLDRGARIDAMNKASWTPIHQAIHSSHADCLHLLLTYKHKPAPNGSTQSSGNDPADNLVDDVIDLVDKDGWTVAHLAASKESKDCLEVLSNLCNLDLERTDKWNHDVYQVASLQCKLFLQSLKSQTEKLCKVYVNVPESRGNKVVDSEWHIGNLLVSADTGWAALEEVLSTIFLSHLSEVEAGVRTRRMRQETPAPSPDGQLPFSLGLSLNSIKYYSIGVYHWSPGTLTERTPWELLGSMNTAVVALQLFGMDDGCVDSLAYETLIPVGVLQNYLRLIEQYKNVIFYGPVSTGKTYMTQKLAQLILKECHRGSSEIHTVQLTESFTSTHLVNILIDKDCLMESTMPVTANNKVTVLILDNLDKVSVSKLFKEVFSVIENRGPSTTMRLETDKREVDYYMHPGCYILGTMDRTRATGLELSIQQHFRWVQFRCDQEPMRCLLHRHLQRRLVSSHSGQLPPSDDRVMKAVEWIVCVWQRLNEGIGKLGLQDLYYGPIIFLACPVEPNKPKAILRWLSLLWNHQLAPAVSEAVLKGSGGDVNTGGQQKVASTALYVLMQRAIVSGCPLSGQEKERYLSSFLGSNELDIKMRTDRKDAGSSVESPQTARKHSTEHSRHSPGSDVNQVNPTTPFHRMSRSPITKATSLDSSLKPPDELELPEQSAYHTSPDLSPSGSSNKNRYGNTYFALAGFPVAKPVQQPTEAQQFAASQVPRGSRFGIPVIVTQPAPSAGASSPLSSQAVSMMNPVESSPLVKSRPAEMKRALSPQPLAAKAWSPGPDPRRALSPGPELLRSYRSKSPEYNNSNSMPKTDAVHPSRPSRLSVGNKLLAPGSPQPGRFPTPVVVNPTKLPPFSNSKPPAFKS